MSWESEVKEIERRRYLAKQQGGEAGIAKQHSPRSHDHSRAH